jgi:hypothetical protein
VVNLPLICKSAGASLGAGIKLMAGSTAWPAKVAGKAFCAWACKAPVAQTSIQAAAAALKRRGNGNFMAVSAEVKGF